MSDSVWHCLVAGFIMSAMPPRDGTHGEIGCLVPHVTVAKRVGSVEHGGIREKGVCVSSE